MMFGRKSLSIGNAKIMFCNFSGKQKKYNKDGSRTFCVVVEDTDKVKVQELIDDGWNVKPLKQRDDAEKPVYYIQVKVNFDNTPPAIQLFEDNPQNYVCDLDKDTVGILDTADIIHVDLVISPYNWEVGDSKGVKGYLKKMYVTVEKDEFADKYSTHEHETAEATSPF